MAGWSQRWLCETREDVERAFKIISHAPLPSWPLEVIARQPRVEKTPEMRRLFHAVVSEIAKQVGDTPANIKTRIKASFYGIEVYRVTDRNGHEMLWADAPSSEDSDREEYSRLIDHAHQWAAEAGVAIQDRRTTYFPKDHQP